MKLLLLITLLFVGLNAYAAQPVPDKTVVLTFDDAVKSHLTVVAPLLQEYGFGATFFVCHAWMNDEEFFLTWEEVAELHRMGFEIGNHTWTHAGLSTPRAAARLAGELALVENELKRVKVPKPISFGWTGNHFGPEATKVLAANGYQLARRGMQPEVHYGMNIPGPFFDPTLHHPLLIPSAGDSYPDTTLEHFKASVDRAKDGRIVVFQFHGVPDEKHPWVHTPVENFRQYMDYLKQEGFNVIALRDLLPYLPEEPVKNDPALRVVYPAPSVNRAYWPTEVLQTREDLDFWLPNMVQHHGYTLEEVQQVTALPEAELEARIAALPERVAPPGVITVLPYPGGRHPRIGFLDGAIDPQRGTKISIFPPWENAGYMVLDLPEAIFSNLGLFYLAHTHVPTIWDDQNQRIENRDWQRHADGSYTLYWPLPNQITFGSKVVPQEEHVDLEFWVENGTEATLTGLRTQICLMLKGAPAFNDCSNDLKRFEGDVAAAKARDADRWVLIAFEECGRAWGNDKCPCMHSDPVLPEAAPGKRSTVKGRLWFYEGTAIEAEIARVQQELDNKHF